MFVDAPFFLFHRITGTFLGCFCQAYELFYEGHTQRTKVMLKDIYSDSDAMNLVMKFYQAIFYEQH